MPRSRNPVENPVTQEGRNGGTLNRGGAQPGAGRPKDAWVQMCRECADKGAKALLAAKVLEDPKHEAFMGAWKFMAEQGYGKAPQSVDVTSGGQPLKGYVLFDPEKDV